MSLCRLHWGSEALSFFRCQRLRERLQAQGISVNAVSARFVHVVDLSASLSPAEEATLHALLTYGTPWSAENAEGAQEWAVVPRLGTVSPWSSKATEIAQVCGLAAVRRLERGVAYYLHGLEGQAPVAEVAALLHDPLTESVLPDWRHAEALFAHPEPRPLRRVPFLQEGLAALEQINGQLGLALSTPELHYLADHYQTLGRDPSDAELMMFAQANSEHCRHKVFNAHFCIDGQDQEQTLFGFIRETHQAHPQGTLSAYKDNAAVMAPWAPSQLFYAGADGCYTQGEESVGILMKVETHNHPTAISPFPGAATGSGGEIRDEGATGRGGKPKMGLTGFSVSHLRVPGWLQSWEGSDYGRPSRIRSALDIMLEAPLGAAAFNNEFGRPSVAGYFRVFEGEHDGRHWGYHKPIMLAGGVGQIRPALIEKLPLPEGAKILVLGGPAMLIGLGGGAASSVASGTGDADLDFASVQRGNPEMQRRAQEVIDRCNALGAESPILSIHDVGAGGLSNAVPELLHDGGRGGMLNLRQVPNEDPAMSPMEIWCNEAQERYVLAVSPARLEEFLTLCARERCPVAVLGEATAAEQLTLTDPLLGDTPVDMPLDTLLGCPPRMERDTRTLPVRVHGLHLEGVDLRRSALDVLRHPSVASKEFLITIGDRSVGGLIARDPMVGPWQVPVADCAVAAGDYWHSHGEAMAMGERSPVAVIDAPASGRLAVAEALTNLFAADIHALGDIKLSANWMAAVQSPGEDTRLYETVRSVVRDLCLELDLSIPVGKDSLSLQTVWQADGAERRVTGPLSLIVSAFAPVADTAATWTPQLQPHTDSQLWLMDLGAGRLGASILAQVLGQMGSEAADLEDAGLLRQAFQFLRQCRADGVVLAYHDRSDGGLWACVCEMSFAGRCGVDWQLDSQEDIWSALFNEEPGFVLQIASPDVQRVREAAQAAGLADRWRLLGSVRPDTWTLRVVQGESLLLEEQGAELHQIWVEPSYRIQALRDEPTGADAAFAQVASASPLLFSRNWAGSQGFPTPALGTAEPTVAILREEGVNGQVEMAAAFARAGFRAVDVHMTDLLSGRQNIGDFPALAACGGFSYGDVLGAGAGWAKSIRFHPQLREQFARFFQDKNRLALGVCNGCQMLAELRDLIPGSTHWPVFRRNRSEQFEARLLMVEVLPSPSPFFAGLAGLQAPIVVAHGEGRAEFASPEAQASVQSTLRFVDAQGQATERYPANPNGSPQGITGVCNADGRVAILMPHPERVVRRAQMSWSPADWGPDTPWLEIFRNARRALT